GVGGEDFPFRDAGRPSALAYARAHARARESGRAPELENVIGDEVVPLRGRDRCVNEVPWRQRHGANPEALGEPAQYGAQARSRRLLESNLHEPLEPPDDVGPGAGVRGARL